MQILTKINLVGLYVLAPLFKSLVDNVVVAVAVFSVVVDVASKLPLSSCDTIEFDRTQ